jgi:chromosomal replication initiator protein
MNPMSSITYIGYPGMFKKPKELQRDVILKAVCEWYSISREKIMEQKRKREVVEARQVAMYLLRRRTHMTLVEIGDFFNGRDHTTVVHSIQKIRDLSDSYPDFKNKIEQMLANI